jgi:hypothetical protein
VLSAPGKTAGDIYPATYELAPLPVRVAPAAVPPGWIAAVYGADSAPAGWLVVRKLPGGVLAAPAPAPN